MLTSFSHPVLGWHHGSSAASKGPAADGELEAQKWPAGCGQDPVIPVIYLTRGSVDTYYIYIYIVSWMYSCPHAFVCVYIYIYIYIYM